VPTPVVELTTEQIVACEGAKRLLADPVFNDTIDELIRDATQKSVILDDAMQREANRQMVLAMMRFRGALEAAVDYVDAARDDAQNAKRFE
jgi:hypothetical protein